MKASPSATVLGVALMALAPALIAGQERGPIATAAPALRAAIDRLADVDYDTRSKAARAVRRAAAPEAVPALAQAVQSHADGYVRFRSLILLTGFDPPRAATLLNEASPNDRLRELAFAFYERYPDRTRTTRLLAALDKETGDFVRPALVRALAAVGDDPLVRDRLLKEVTRGADHFRSSVIEALGDYRQGYATASLLAVARLEGPLQDDAVLALGKIGDKTALETLAALQRTGARTLQPTVAAAICLLGVNCSSHLGYLEKVLGFADDNPGYQDLVRAASFGLDAVAIKGNSDALQILFTAGIPSLDPIRAPLALSVAKVAMRNTELLQRVLAAHPAQEGALALLAEGFDMLQEDLEEEQFFVNVRRGYWASADGSPARTLAEKLIAKLDF